MGQEEIYNLLKKHNWMLSKEILSVHPMSNGGLYRCLRLLINSGEVIRKKAREVIKDKQRLNKSAKNAWAYRIKIISKTK
jgi:hypothetical protein